MYYKLSRVTPEDVSIVPMVFATFYTSSDENLQIMVFQNDYGYYRFYIRDAQKQRITSTYDYPSSAIAACETKICNEKHEHIGYEGLQILADCLDDISIAYGLE